VLDGVTVVMFLCEDGFEVRMVVNDEVVTPLVDNDADIVVETLLVVPFDDCVLVAMVAVGVIDVDMFED
jgi:hypothetical protein